MENSLYKEFSSLGLATAALARDLPESLRLDRLVNVALIVPGQDLRAIAAQLRRLAVFTHPAKRDPLGILSPP